MVLSGILSSLCSWFEYSFLLRSLKMGRNIVFGGVLVFLFSTQNQVPQIIIGLDWVIYHINALIVVIGTTLKNFKKKSQCREKPVWWIFIILFRTNKSSKQSYFNCLKAYNSLFWNVKNKFYLSNVSLLWVFQRLFGIKLSTKILFDFFSFF